MESAYVLNESQHVVSLLLPGYCVSRSIIFIQLLYKEMSVL